MDTKCWIARGKTRPGRYGRFYINGLTFDAHRVSYTLFKGKIPAGLQIDHLCRNRTCINPKHLEAVTSRVNTLRGNSLQAQNAKKTHCKYGHPFIQSNLVKSQLKQGRRECLICCRAHWRKYNKKRSKNSNHNNLSKS